MQATAASDSQSPRPRQGSAKAALILPVDDERVVARDIQLRLRRLGYDVPAVASSKAEAIDLLQSFKPDLVLMDIQLNGTPEGIAAAREIGTRFETPVIYLTAHSDPETLEMAQTAEPFGYVLRPFQDRELVATIETALHRHRIEARLRETARWLRQETNLISLSHDAIIMADANRVITAWNAGAQEMYGWTEEEAVGGMTHELLRTRSATPLAETDRALSLEGRWDGELIQTARDGKEMFVESRQIQVRGHTGGTIGILEIDRDITEKKRAEAALQETCRALKSAVTEKTVLLKEIQHRAKNNLAVISSLLAMKADAMETAEAKLALAESQQRVRSIAMIHEQLHGTEHLDRIDLREYVRRLADEVSVAFGGEARGISIRVDADPIELGVEIAVPCALIVNELVTNAFKHAFPDHRSGEIRIWFREPEYGQFELGIEDDGVGGSTTHGAQERQPLGLRIVEILTKQLGGALEQESREGRRVVLRFPARP